MKPEPSIAICEPSETFRQALATTLRGAEMHVVALVPDLDQLLRLGCDSCAEMMVLVGESEPGLIRSRRIDGLRRAFPDAYIVLLVASGRGIDLARAATVDVDGILSKSLPGRVILESLAIIFSGGRVIMLDAIAEEPDGRDIAWSLPSAQDSPPAETSSARTAENAGSAALQNAGGKLTLRETDILKCLGRGMPNKVIARQFEIGEATVKVHIKSILRKINVANRTQAAIWAIHHQQAAQSFPALVSS